MRVEHFPAAVSAAELRALAPAPADVSGEVARIVAEVREGGDSAVRRLTGALDGVDVPPERLRLTTEELAAARDALDPELARALRTAMANVERVAEAQVGAARRVELEQGQSVEIEELPVRRAAAYVPGGRAPYPSSVVMAAVTARAAGVAELAVCTPPGPQGDPHPVVPAACALCGVGEVYRMGGAQAVAALAHGTDSVPAVDVVVGPGNAYVTEAKRQLFGTVGIDGLAGPSELVVLASAGADPELVALDLLAQAEHGPASLVVAICDDEPLLERVAAALDREPLEATAALVAVPSAERGLRLAEQIAPEHLELAGAAAEALADRVRSAGCLFVGACAATAFGDYVAGSNHVLPTGGAARWASALSPATFRRRMARVTVPPAAAAALAPAGAAIAEAEGFRFHARSMTRRA